MVVLNLGLIWPLCLLLAARRGFAQGCWRDSPCDGPSSASFPGEWESNMFTPSSRNIGPETVTSLSGEKFDSTTERIQLSSVATDAVFDFGKEVGGLVTINYTVLTGTNTKLGIAFTESSDFIGRSSDSSSGALADGEAGSDGALYTTVHGPGDFTYQMPPDKMRGGFRYMTVFLPSTASSVRVNKVSVELSFQPTWSDLQAYQGYFHSSDDQINKIWYSGAYTLQTNSLPPHTGRYWDHGPFRGGWNNGATIGEGNTILTDAAKRDRTVWPGDMGVAVPSAFYSTGDMMSTKNALLTAYKYQADNGLLPFSGPPLNAKGSVTYHMWSMIGTYNYMLYTDDTDFLQGIWSGYQNAMNYIHGCVDEVSGLVHISSSTADWGRFNANGSLTSAQALYYRTLQTGAEMATWLNDSSGLHDNWTQRAQSVYDKTNQQSWDNTKGAFYDAPERKDLHSQDGNSLAVMFGLVPATSERARRISDYLAQNWVDIGALCPELPGEISPFISSFEIQAHLRAQHPERALELIRRSWGWYLNNQKGTQSTMVEGYLENGTFGYRWDAGYRNDFSLTSHSHGWSTGPVSTLSTEILGLSVTGRAGTTWQLAPQFGDLKNCEGGFTTSKGKFQANWSRGNHTTGDDRIVTLFYDTPKDTTGQLILPLTIPSTTMKKSMIKPSKISVDGAVIQGNSTNVMNEMTYELPGGHHEVVIVFSSATAARTLSAHEAGSSTSAAMVVSQRSQVSLLARFSMVLGTAMWLTG